MNCLLTFLVTTFLYATATHLSISLDPLLLPIHTLPSTISIPSNHFLHSGTVYEGQDNQRVREVSMFMPPQKVQINSQGEHLILPQSETSNKKLKRESVGEYSKDTGTNKLNQTLELLTDEDKLVVSDNTHNVIETVGETPDDKFKTKKLGFQPIIPRNVDDVTQVFGRRRVKIASNVVVTNGKSVIEQFLYARNQDSRTGILRSPLSLPPKLLELCKNLVRQLNDRATVPLPQADYLPIPLKDIIFQLTYPQVRHVNKVLQEFQNEQSKNSKTNLPFCFLYPNRLTEVFNLLKNEQHYPKLGKNIVLLSQYDEVKFNDLPSQIGKLKREIDFPILRLDISPDLNLSTLENIGLDLIRLSMLGLLNLPSNNIQKEITLGLETNVKRNAALNLASKITAETTESIKSMMPELSAKVPGLIYVKVEGPKATKNISNLKFARSGGIDLKELAEELEQERTNLVTNSRVRRDPADVKSFNLLRVLSAYIGAQRGILKNKDKSGKNEFKNAKEKIKKKVSVSIGNLRLGGVILNDPHIKVRKSYNSFGYGYECGCLCCQRRRHEQYLQQYYQQYYQHYYQHYYQQHYQHYYHQNHVKKNKHKLTKIEFKVIGGPSVNIKHKKNNKKLISGTINFIHNVINVKAKGKHYRLNVSETHPGNLPSQPSGTIKVTNTTQTKVLQEESPTIEVAYRLNMVNKQKPIIVTDTRPQVDLTKLTTNITVQVPHYKYTKNNHIRAVDEVDHKQKNTEFKVTEEPSVNIIDEKNNKQISNVRNGTYESIVKAEHQTINVLEINTENVPSQPSGSMKVTNNTQTQELAKEHFIDEVVDNVSKPKPFKATDLQLQDDLTELTVNNTVQVPYYNYTTNNHSSVVEVDDDRQNKSEVEVIGVRSVKQIFDQKNNNEQISNMVNVTHDKIVTEEHKTIKDTEEYPENLPSQRSGITKVTNIIWTQELVKKQPTVRVVDNVIEQKHIEVTDTQPQLDVTKRTINITVQVPYYNYTKNNHSIVAEVDDHKQNQSEVEVIGESSIRLVEEKNNNKLIFSRINNTHSMVKVEHNTINISEVYPENLLFQRPGTTKVANNTLTQELAKEHPAAEVVGNVDKQKHIEVTNLQPQVDLTKLIKLNSTAQVLYYNYTTNNQSSVVEVEGHKQNQLEVEVIREPSVSIVDEKNNQKPIFSMINVTHNSIVKEEHNTVVNDHKLNQSEVEMIGKSSVNIVGEKNNSKQISSTINTTHNSKVKEEHKTFNISEVYPEKLPFQRSGTKKLTNITWTQELTKEHPAVEVVHNVDEQKPIEVTDLQPQVNLTKPTVNITVQVDHHNYTSNNHLSVEEVNDHKQNQSEVEMIGESSVNIVDEKNNSKQISSTINITDNSIGKEEHNTFNISEANPENLPSQRSGTMKVTNNKQTQELAKENPAAEVVDNVREQKPIEVTDLQPQVNLFKHSINITGQVPYYNYTTINIHSSVDEVEDHKQNQSEVEMIGESSVHIVDEKNNSKQISSTINITHNSIVKEEHNTFKISEAYPENLPSQRSGITKVTNITWTRELAKENPAVEVVDNVDEQKPIEVTDLQPQITMNSTVQVPYYNYTTINNHSSVDEVKGHKQNQSEVEMIGESSVNIIDEKNNSKQISSMINITHNSIVKEEHNTFNIAEKYPENFPFQRSGITKDANITWTQEFAKEHPAVEVVDNLDEQKPIEVTDLHPQDDLTKHTVNITVQVPHHNYTTNNHSSVVEGYGGYDHKEKKTEVEVTGESSVNIVDEKNNNKLISSTLNITHIVKEEHHCVNGSEIIQRNVENNNYTTGNYRTGKDNLPSQPSGTIEVTLNKQTIELPDKHSKTVDNFYREYSGHTIEVEKYPKSAQMDIRYKRRQYNTGNGEADSIPSSLITTIQNQRIPLKIKATQCTICFWVPGWITLHTKKIVNVPSNYERLYHKRYKVIHGVLQDYTQEGIRKVLRRRRPVPQLYYRPEVPDFIASHNDEGAYVNTASAHDVFENVPIHLQNRRKSQRFLPMIISLFTGLKKKGNIRSSLNLRKTPRVSATSQDRVQLQVQASRGLNVGIKTKRSASHTKQSFRRDCTLCQQGSENHQGYVVQNAYGPNGEQLQVVDLLGDMNLQNPEVKNDLEPRLLVDPGNIIDNVKRSEIIIDGTEERKENAKLGNVEIEVANKEFGILGNDNAEREMRLEKRGEEEINPGKDGKDVVISLKHVIKNTGENEQKEVGTVQDQDNFEVSVNHPKIDVRELQSEKQNEKQVVTEQYPNIEVKDNKNNPEQMGHLDSAEHTKNAMKQTKNVERPYVTETLKVIDQLPGVLDYNTLGRTGLYTDIKSLVTEGQLQNANVSEKNNGNVDVNYNRDLELSDNLHSLKEPRHIKLTGNLEVDNFHAGKLQLTGQLPKLDLSGDNIAKINVNDDSDVIRKFGLTGYNAESTPVDLHKIELSENQIENPVIRQTNMNVAGSLSKVEVKKGLEGSAKAAHQITKIGVTGHLPGLKLEGQRDKIDVTHNTNTHSQLNINGGLSKHLEVKGGLGDTTTADLNLELGHYNTENFPKTYVRDNQVTNQAHLNIARSIVEVTKGLLRLPFINVDFSISPLGNNRGYKINSRRIRDVGYNGVRNVTRNRPRQYYSGSTQVNKFLRLSASWG